MARPRRWVTDLDPSGSEAAAQAAEQRRLRWQTPAAWSVVGLHLASMLGVGLWFYFVIARWKRGFEDMDTEITNDVMFLITLGDAFVNYWYLALPFAAAFAAVDYLIARWLIIRLGLRWTAAYAVGLAVLILSQAVVGEAVLRSVH